MRPTTPARSVRARERTDDCDGAVFAAAPAASSKLAAASAWLVCTARLALAEMDERNGRRAIGPSVGDGVNRTWSCAAHLKCRIYGIEAYCRRNAHTGGDGAALEDGKDYASFTA